MDTKYAPVFLLRSYVWDVLKANTTMDEGDYGNKVPIVPVQEEPELTQYSGPYLVYGYAINPTTRVHAMSEGSMTLVVYSQNFGTITKILNILQEALGRYDESATSVNKYTSQVEQYIGIRFTSISVGFVEGGTPEDTEGGRQSGMINIRFGYVPTFSVNVDPTPTI